MLIAASKLFGHDKRIVRQRYSHGAQPLRYDDDRWHAVHLLRDLRVVGLWPLPLLARRSLSPPQSTPLHIAHSKSCLTRPLTAAASVARCCSPARARSLNVYTNTRDAYSNWQSLALPLLTALQARPTA